MNDLHKRLFSSAVLTLLLLSLIVFDVPLVIALGALVFVFWGSVEFYDLVQQKGLKASKWYGTISNIAIITLVAVFAAAGKNSLAILPWIFLLCASGAFVRQLFVGTTNHAIFGISTTILGIFYMGYLFSFLVLLRFFPSMEQGKWYLCSAVIMIKFSDIFAFFAGSLFGRHKLKSAVSPNKSVEGLVAGVIGSIVGGLIVYYFIDAVNFRFIDVLVLGFIIGVMAEIGDLAESLLKRDAEIKDSNRLLPGMGGVLDVLDSTLLCAPIFYFYVRYIIR